MVLVWVITIEFAQNLYDIRVRVRSRECVASTVKTENQLLRELCWFRPLVAIAQRRHRGSEIEMLTWLGGRDVWKSGGQ